MTNNRILTGRRAFLLGSGALVGMGAATIAGKFSHLNSLIQADGDTERDFAVAETAPLRVQAAAKGLIYGAASSYKFLSSNPALAALFAQQCSMLVPSGELKWNTICPSPDRFNFTRADWMVEFARTHGMLFRGHTLVWHHALPRWFKKKVNRQNAKQVMLKHIATVAGRYAGKVHSWDVVNEPLNPEKRENAWFELLGPDYIEIAFRAAAEADPQALLVLNENGLDHSTRVADKKRADMLRLLERLKSNGTPVQALGMEAHLFRTSDENRFDPTTLRKFLSDVASLDLKILITEMDVTDRHFPSDTAVRDRLVAGAYEDYLSIVLDEPAVIAIVTWGLSDRYTWLSKRRPREDGMPVRSLPFDTDLKPKLAYNAVARAFEQAPVYEARMRLYEAEVRLPKQIAFQDVQGHWAQGYIQALSAKNIISGFPDGTFRPNAPVSRAEFAAIINQAFAPVQQNKNATPFQDVPQNFWGYNAIQTATKSGFLVGYPSGVFQPSQQIPRVQVLASLGSGLKLGSADTSVLSFYQDAAQVPAYAANNVAAATQRKMVVNYPTIKRLNPNREATRAEVAAFVYQALVNAGKAEPISSPYIVAPSS